MNRPITTLFMLISLDSKISTGDNDLRDFDKDLPKIKDLKEGLYQYYKIEKTTDFASLNSGKVMAKIGMNSDSPPINAPRVTFIIIDNSHMTSKGLENLINNTKKLILVTANKNHLAFGLKQSKKLKILFYNTKINFPDLFQKLKTEQKIKKLTIQSGSTLNSILIRENLIDKISIVVAPCLIGGENTASLIGGRSISTPGGLSQIKTLKLINCKKLKNSYLYLQYEVRK